MATLTPIPGPPFRYRTFSNVQPFTYEDGLTVAETISRWLKYFREEILPILNNGIPGEIDRLEQLIADLQAQIDIHEVRIDELEEMIQAIIDNSIIAQDPVVAALVNDSLSQTGIALRALFPEKALLPYVNIADYGAPLNGTDSDTQAFRDAYDAVAEGGTITAPTGAPVRISDIDLTGKGVTVDFRGNTITQDTDAAVFRVTGVFTDSQACAVLDRRTLSVLDGTAYTTGDTVRVFSDDQIRGARPDADGGPLLGMSATIRAIEGNQVTLNTAINDTYATNVRIAKYDIARYSIAAGAIQTPDGEQLTRTSTFAAFRGLVSPHFEAAMFRSGNSGVSFTSCHRPYADIRAEDFLNDTGIHNGYALSDGGSNAGEYHIQARNVRHAFTDGPSGNTTIPGNPDPAAYGRSENARVFVIADGCWDSGISPHHGGRGHTFLAPILRGTNGSAIALRGEGHRVQGGRITGWGFGVRVFGEDAFPTATSYGHAVADVYMEDVHTAYVANESATADRGDAFTPTLTISGGVHRINRKGFDATRGRVVLSGRPVFIMRGPQLDEAGFGTFAQFFAGSLKGEIDVDLSAITTGPVNTIVNVGSANTRMDLTLYSTLSTHVRDNINFVTNGASSMFDIDAVLSGYDGRGFHNGSLPTNQQKYTWRNSDDELSSREFLYDGSLTGNLLIKIPSNDFVVRLAGDGGAINFIPGGSYGGQRLTFVHVNDAGTTTLNGGSSVRLPAGPVALGPDVQYSLIWDSTDNLWRGE